MFYLGMCKDRNIETQEQGNQVALPVNVHLNDLSKLECKHYLKLWQMLKAQIPSIEAKLLDFRQHPTKLNDLISKMMKVIGEARSQDSFNLKEPILVYIAYCSPSGRLEPPIQSGTKKSDTRGWKHPTLARLLCLVQYLEEFDADPKGTIKRLEEGCIPFTSNDFPALMYAEGSFNPDNVLEGLFMHLLPIIVAKHLFCCPSSALKPAGTSVTTKASQAKKHEFRRITERTIAYAMFQTLWGLCSQDDLRLDEGSLVKELYFKVIVDTLASDIVDKTWANSILDHWTEQVLGPVSTKSKPVQHTIPSIRDAIRSQQQHNLTVTTSGGTTLSSANSRNTGVEEMHGTRPSTVATNVLDTRRLSPTPGPSAVRPHPRPVHHQFNNTTNVLDTRRLSLTPGPSSARSESRQWSPSPVLSESNPVMSHVSDEVSNPASTCSHCTSGPEGIPMAPVVPPNVNQTPLMLVCQGSPLTEDECDEAEVPVMAKGKGKGKAPARSGGTKQGPEPVAASNKRKAAAGSGEGEPARKRGGRGGRGRSRK